MGKLILILTVYTALLLLPLTTPPQLHALNTNPCRICSGCSCIASSYYPSNCNVEFNRCDYNSDCCAPTSPPVNHTPTPVPNMCEDNAGKCVPSQYVCTPSATINKSCPNGEEKCVGEAAVCSPPPTITPTPFPACPYACIDSVFCSGEGGAIAPGYSCASGKVCCSLPPPPTPSISPIPWPRYGQECRDFYQGECIPKESVCSDSTVYYADCYEIFDKCVPKTISCTMGPGGKCINNSDCLSNLFCNTSFAVCSQKKPDGFWCNTHSACLSGYCDIYNSICQNPTASVTPACLGENSYCANYTLPCCNGYYCDIDTRLCTSYQTCVPGSQKCTPSTQNGTGPTLMTCNSTGTGWLMTQCSELSVCNPSKNTCTYPPYLADVGTPCRGNSECMSGNCAYNSSSSLYQCSSSFICSEDGNFRLEVHQDGGINWSRSQVCALGCDSSTKSCREQQTLECSSLNTGTISYDKKEYCWFGTWRCFDSIDGAPNRRRLTTPATNSGGATFQRCINHVWHNDWEYNNNFYSQYYCSGNTLFRHNASGDIEIKTCTADTYCLDSSNGIQPDCYQAEKALNYLACYPGKTITTLNGQPIICGNETLPVISSKISDTFLTNKQYNYLLDTKCTNTSALSNTVYTGGIEWSEGTFMENCRLFCNSSGKVSTENCHSRLSTASDIYCGQDDNVYKRVPTFDRDVLVQQCSNGCSNGACLTTENISCTEEGKVSPAGNNRYLICRNGKYTPYANNAEIEWIACPNEYIYPLMESVSHVSDYLFDTSKFPPIICQNNNTDFYGRVMSNIHKPIDLTIACGSDVSSNLCRYVFIHELTHSKAVTQDKIMSDGVENSEFNKVIGCTENITSPGVYTFSKEKPVTSYGETNCAEALAEASTKYALPDSACDMKKNQPCQYQFFLNGKSSFYNINNEHKEWCNDSTIPLECPSNSTSTHLYQAYAQTITPTPPPDYFPQLNTLTINSALSLELVEQAEMGISTPLGYYYAFTSKSVSHNHVVRTNEQGIINYISLVIPEDSQKIYANTLKISGKPEVVLGNTPSEYIYAYPSQGAAFIVNTYGPLIKQVITFTPMTVSDFVPQFASDLKIITLDPPDPLPDFDNDNDVDIIDSFIGIDTPNLDLMQQFNLNVRNMGRMR